MVTCLRKFKFNTGLKFLLLSKQPILNPRAILEVPVLYYAKKVCISSYLNELPHLLQCPSLPCF